jgi:hypothetical protein
VRPNFGSRTPDAKLSVILLTGIEEVHMTNVCEGCRRHTELSYVRRADAYLCEECEEMACEEVTELRERGELEE